MVLVYLKNLLLPSQKPSRHETPPLLPTTDLPKHYGTSTRDTPTRHPPCPRRPSQKPLPPSTSASTTTTTSSSSSTTTTTTPSKKPYIDPRVLSDLTIGLSDGLTVPFALTAGLSAFNDTTVVLYGGLAELIAGSISMGLGGWLAGRGEAAFHANTLAATRTLVRASPEAVRPLLAGVFRPYGVSEGVVVEELLAGEEELLVAFVMQFHYNLPAVEEAGRTPVSSAATIAAGYFFGGFVPLVPYVFVGRGDVLVGLRWSVIVMVVCLFVFGGGKTVLVDAAEEGKKKHWGSIVRGGIEMVLVGGVAAAAAMGIVRALGGLS
ncbi:VIT family-domain-containing protein [Morchella snyderi]|nr:VIT family-domain-containing protein [Morchella snyderi]